MERPHGGKSSSCALVSRVRGPGQPPSPVATQTDRMAHVMRVVMCITVQGMGVPCERIGHLFHLSRCSVPRLELLLCVYLMSETPVCGVLCPQLHGEMVPPCKCKPPRPSRHKVSRHGYGYYCCETSSCGYFAWEDMVVVQPPPAGMQPALGIPIQRATPLLRIFLPWPQVPSASAAWQQS
jgi:hypothetical protein